MKIEWLLVLGISLVLIYMCYTDIRWRRIANGATLVLLVLSVLLGCLTLHGPSLLLPAGLFVIGFIVSMLGVIGAGDVKLASALAVALSPTEIGNFLLLTSMAGVPLSLVTLLYYRCFACQKSVTIPYGIALSCGYWLQLAI